MDTNLIIYTWNWCVHRTQEQMRAMLDASVAAGDIIAYAILPASPGHDGHPDGWAVRMADDGRPAGVDGICRVPTGWDTEHGI